jgi:ATP-binding cassette subfamily F protein uup
MNVVDAIRLEKSFGPRTILRDATFAVGETEKVGLIGANGSGKSTLLQILAGLTDRDGGEVMVKRRATIGYLPQEPVIDGALTAAEAIEAALKEIRRAIDEFNGISAALAGSPPDMDRLLERQGELAGWIEHHGGWNTDHRVAGIMTHLQLADPDQRIAEMSGGTRRRVALARLLLEAPDLLLLDEPTNHLDADTVQWLQDYLLDYPGALLLITHDRYFLDRVATRMLELENGELTSFPGGYSRYLEQKGEQLQQQAGTRARLLNLLRTETAWIRRGAKARTTKQKARIDRYQQLQEDVAATGSTAGAASVAFTTDAGFGGTILDLADVAKSYGDNRLMDGLTFGLKRGDRVGIIGPNGCGKTTLIRMIVGEEMPDAGTVTLGKKTQIAWFDQNREQLDPEQTVYDFFGEGDYVQVNGVKRHKIGYLEEFLFVPSDRVRRISTLSGGEKSRLLLARLMLQGANLLILDEPTNDLDIPTMQLLDETLASFPGCVLLVTHDRFFLDKVATGILAFEGDGRVVVHEGNYSEYRERKDAERAAVSEAAAAVRQAATASAAIPLKAKRGLNFNERRELEQLEQEIERLEGEKGGLEAKLADPLAHGATPGEVAEIAAAYGRLDEQLTVAYARWEELETKRTDALV